MTNNGVYIPVNLDSLIEEIIVAPGCPDWFLELVKREVEENNINKTVKRSVVDDEPYTFDLTPYKDLE
jgi:hypothetical protein